MKTEKKLTGLNVIDESKRQKLNRPITGVIHEDRIWEQW